MSEVGRVRIKEIELERAMKKGPKHYQKLMGKYGVPISGHYTMQISRDENTKEKIFTWEKH